MTPYHSQYWAHALTLQSAAGSIETLSRSLSKARVDLNPHQVDAALLALRSPLSKGAILADEVGLGKTPEAGIVIAQHDTLTTDRVEVQMKQRQACYRAFTVQWQV